MGDPEPQDRETIGAGKPEPEATVADIGPKDHPDLLGSTRTSDVGPGEATVGATNAHGTSATASGVGDATYPDQADSFSTHRPVPTIVGYQIEGEIGRGAMGVVYRARQVGLNRLCALKVILAGVHADPVAAVRFLGEAEAVAKLQHANIVQIHHVGEADGLPFLELEYVEGGSLDQRLDGTPWLAQRAATLMEALARGVAEAHRLGVIHRDLKPSNILIAADGTAKVADFGLAKSLNVESGLTATDSILGSPSYMAPEQAEGKTKQVGPLADVYALGAILYELLVGRPPFRGTTVLETLEQVRTAEPVPPSRLVPGTPRDAETIALKCLQKDPTKRYLSAAALGEDLRRFLAGEPILARRTGPVERSWRWCRRNPALASLWASLLVVLLTGTAIASYYAVRARDGERQALANAAEIDRQRGDAVAQAKVLQRRDYINRVNLALSECLGNNVARALELLAGCPADLRGWEWSYVESQCHLDLRTFHEPGGQAVNGLAFSPDGTRIASVSGAIQRDEPARKGDLVVRDVVTGREIFSHPNVASGFRGVAFSPDGRWIATGNASELVILNAATGEVEFRLPDLGNRDYPVLSLAFSPDSRRIIAGYGEFNSDQGVGHANLWDLTSRQLIETIPGSRGTVYSVAFSPDGSEVALARDGLVEVCDVKAPTRPIRVLRGHTGFVYAVAFSPGDGRYIASGGFDRTLRLWDRATGNEIRAFYGHEGIVRGLAFSPDGQRLLSASEDNSLRLWEVASSRPLADFHGHQLIASCVAFSPDGRLFASGGTDHAVKLWLATSSPQLTFTGHDGWVGSLVFRSDGRRIVSGAGNHSTRGQVIQWDATTGDPLEPSFEGCPRVWTVALHRDGRRLATACRGDGTVRVWNIDTGRPVWEKKGHAINAFDVAYSPDGRWLASAGYGHDSLETGEVRLWDAETGLEIHTFVVHAAVVKRVAFSPDGRYLASGGRDGMVRIWDTRDPAGKAREWAGHIGEVERVMFLPDGRLASAGGTGSELGVVKIWDLTTERVLELRGHTAKVHGLAYSPAGRRLATSSDDRTIKLWDTTTGEEIFTLRGHTRGVVCVAFSPDGRRLASGSWDQTVRIWDTDPPASHTLFRLRAEARAGPSELPDNPFAP